MLQSFREIFQTLNLDKRVVAIETRACPEPRPERFIFLFILPHKSSIPQ
jgi:hypothetical protein